MVWLFAVRGVCVLFAAATPAHVNSQALDFLVQRGKRNQKSLCRLGLIPAAALQHVNNDATLDFVHDLEQRRIGIVGSGARAGFTRKRWQKFGKLQAHTAHKFFAAKRIRKQIHVDPFLRGKRHGALNHIFPFAHMPGQS